MDPSYDVVYVNGERNADHRTVPPGWSGPVPTVSGRRTVVVPPTNRPTVIYSRTPATSYPQQQFYGQPYPGQPYYGPAVPSFASRFGMSTGELIDTGIQILAAIQSLPVGPTSQGDTTTDIENLVTYQGALASYAKRDEQLRTLGTLLVRILK